MHLTCVEDLIAWLRDTHAAGELDLQPELCPPNMQGDITINCFRLTRAIKGNPMQTAQQIGDYLRAHADVAEVEVIKAFVNVTLTSAALFRDTVADAEALLTAAELPPADRRRYLVEYSAPNTNKPMHLGHVRNNTLGQANCAILAKAGHHVTPVNLVNDRGIHICKSMLAYDRFGNGATPDSTSKKGDHLVGDYYVKYASEEKRQEEAGEADAEGVTPIAREAQEMLRKWEAGDEAVRTLWRTMNSWVLDGFRQTYARMGIDFAKIYFESDTYTLGRELVNEGLENGVFYKRDDGAIEIDLSDQKLDKKVVLRSDGTTVYITQDLGTTLLKYNDFQPQRMVWIVGDEQIYHFKVLFAILRALGYAWADDCFHLPYGMVNLTTGKMKSREGTVVDADNLFDDLTGLAREATLERLDYHPPDDLDERAETIAMAAIKFMLLKVSPKTTMIFDAEASLRFEGDTGPYVLYAYARTASVLRNAAASDLPEAELDWALLSAPQERALALRLALYGETIQQAAADLDPSKLADYLLNLAKEFAKFWQECPVLKAESPALARTRLALCERVNSVLGDGLGALSIGTLEAM